ncbi:MAG: 50S ribosomal protein L25 [Thermoguttaceae bacterium]|jgi:large subunit ribosomal protein L25
MAEQLEVVARGRGGKHVNRRLRRAGQIPAVLYGHGEENLCLAVPTEALEGVLRHGSRLVALSGAVSESAFIRQLQWDTYGTHVLHVDFTRISADELVKVTVSVELRGEAPGVKEAGVVDQQISTVNIECPAGSIPEKIYVNINHLKLNDSIKLAQLDLPEKGRVFGDPEAVVVQCIVPVEKPEAESAEAVPGEPEVIGAKKEEESEEE